LEMTMTAHPPNRRTHLEMDAVIGSFKTGMVRYGIIFAVIAMIAGVLGVTGVAGAAVGVAKLLLFISLIICALLLTFASVVGKRFK